MGYYEVVSLEITTRSCWLGRLIRDVAENIRWAVISPYKFLFVRYVPDRVTGEEVMMYSMPEGLIYDGIAELVKLMRNVTDIVLCLPEYAQEQRNTIIDDAVQLLERQTNDAVRNNFGLLQRVGYTASSFDDVVALIMGGICCNDYPLCCCLEELSKRTAKYTPLDEHYYTLSLNYPHGVVTQATAPWLRTALTTYFAETESEYNVLPAELAIQCHDVLAKRTTLYTMLNTQDTYYMPDLMRIDTLPHGITLKQLCHLVVCDITAYRNGLTKDLLYTLNYFPGKLQAVHAIRIDTLGYLYINDALVNFTLDFNTLLHIPDDTIWCAVLGFSQKEFYELYYEQHAQADPLEENASMAVFAQILQEIHIPRWGNLFDPTQLTAFKELSSLRIDAQDVVARFYYELSSPTFTQCVTPLRKLTAQNTYICGCAVAHAGVLYVDDMPIRENFLRACTLLSNSLRRYLHLYFDSLLAGRTL